MDMSSNNVDRSVSICIASYNMSDTIEESLQTITKDLPENFEIVIIDQSNDGSKEIIDNFIRNSNLLFKKKYFDNPLGVTRARNIALQEATGDLVITHVDVDDWYDSRYFVALSELYLILRDKQGSDFFFDCPNMNISSREHMVEQYTMPSLPIGASGTAFRWRAHRNGDYLGLRLDTEITGRIKLSDRKTITSRIKRTYFRYLGMYKIGYSTRRIVRQDIIESTTWSVHSRLFRAVILPIVWIHSLFVPQICDAPIDGKDLEELTEASLYTFEDLKDKYEINEQIMVDRLLDEEK